MYDECAWDPIKQWFIAPFKIADVQVTAVRARAIADLIWIASKLSLHNELRELSEMHYLLLNR